MTCKIESEEKLFMGRALTISGFYMIQGRSMEAFLQVRDQLVQTVHDLLRRSVTWKQVLISIETS